MFDDNFVHEFIDRNRLDQNVLKTHNPEVLKCFTKNPVVKKINFVI